MLALACTARAGAADAAPDAQALSDCAAIEDAGARLACFDRVVPPPAGGRRAGAAAATTEPPAPHPSMLEDRWSIGVPGRDGRFDFQPHKPSYFLFGRYSTSPNLLPTSPTKAPLAEPLDIDRVESKFQISFKVKIADFEDALGSSLWVGYTQQSHWQVYNPTVSRPFRETDYEPEVMMAFHPDRHLLGWRWRLLVLGVSHQSNGRSDPLSRSWNRVYAQFGLEQGNFGVLIRPWLRIPERRADDDNPDIERYLGYGDIVGVYRWGRQTLSALARYNVATHKGALQLGWNFPLARHWYGYVQAFSGYGESLIDYNVPQNTIGIGLSLSDFL